ncbi:MAG: hypothetical protein IJU44_02755 [Kiritimatiellae bacterium]|nr:hypothetical protein [Kiritimatiellia bacterium]
MGTGFGLSAYPGRADGTVNAVTNAVAERFTICPVAGSTLTVRGGGSIILALAQPEIEEVEEEENKDADDPTGLLEDIAKVDSSKIAAMPTPDVSDPDPAKHEEVGALPVKMYKGLWYQASWGTDLNNLTPGVKFRADGTQTHLVSLSRPVSADSTRLP